MIDPVRRCMQSAWEYIVQPLVTTVYRAWACWGSICETPPESELSPPVPPFSKHGARCGGQPVRRLLWKEFHHGELVVLSREGRPAGQRLCDVWLEELQRLWSLLVPSSAGNPRAVRPAGIGRLCTFFWR